MYDLHLTTISADNRLYLWRAGRIYGAGARSWRGNSIGIKVIVHFDGTIPIRVSKQAAYIPEVHNYKVGLAFLFAQTGTTANDLLELGHRANHFVQHDQLGHLTVCTGGQQFGSCGDNRAFLAGGNEIFQFALSVKVTAGNTDNIIGILLNHIRIQIDQGNTHTLCSIFIGAEHDGFGHAVGALQVSSDFGGYLLHPILNNDVVIIITIGVNAVWNLHTVYIQLTTLRMPTVTDIRHNIDDFEGRKETILHAFL